MLWAGCRMPPFQLSWQCGGDVSPKFTAVIIREQELTTLWSVWLQRFRKAGDVEDVLSALNMGWSF